MNNLSDGVQFIGLFISFPISKRNRRTDILRQLLDLEDHLLFQSIRYRKFLDKVSMERFDEGLLRKVIDSIAAGNVDSLELLSYWKNEDWIRSYETSVSLDWTSSFIDKPTDPPPALADKPVRNSGTIMITYPESRFLRGAESSFQARLMSLLKYLSANEEMNWIFVNQGFRPIRPGSIGTDDVFVKTRTGFPLTSLEPDLFAGRSLFYDYVKGGFWANFLNSNHVERLGGMARIRSEKPTSVVEDLGQGRVLLQVGPSPLVTDRTKVIPEYQKLRAFLKPILIETPQEWLNLRDKIFSSTSPRDRNEPQ